MDSSTLLVDEFIIAQDKLLLLTHCQDKIEKLFNINIKYGKVGWDVRSKKVQWVGLEGETEDRKNAKEYIISLCMPEDSVRVPFPAWLASAICLPEALEKLETQTHAALIPLSNYEVSVLGSQLSVTLAMSAFEDLIYQTECEFANNNVNAAALELALRQEKSSSTHLAVKNATDTEKQSGSIPLRSPASARLNMLLEEALSQNCDGMSKPEDYLNTPDLVKRVMVGCLTEPSDNSIHGCIVRDLFPDAVDGLKKSIHNEGKDSGNKAEGDVTVSPTQQAVRGISGKLQSFSLETTPNSPNEEDPVVIDICGNEEIIVLDDSPVVSRTRSKTKIKESETNVACESPIEDSLVSAIKNSKKVSDYWQRLARDFHEESNLSLEEMRRRKEDRLKVLMDYFKEEKQKGKTTCADIGATVFQQQQPILENITDSGHCGASQKKRAKKRKNAKKKKVPTATLR